MKKLIAATMVALMMFAVATSAFALVVDTPSAYKNPPVFISGMTVSDAWMSGLTVQNWQGALTNQAYAEGSYIWFIAKISVAASGDTDAAHLWTGANEKATLTISGKDNCLNFSSANMATFAMINGMNVTARQIASSNQSIVEAAENNVKYTFYAQDFSGMDVNSKAVVYPENLATLRLDAIHGADYLVQEAGKAAEVRTAAKNTYANATFSRATSQKDYYLHFMGITKSSTEGVCVATLKVNGVSSFERDGMAAPAASYTSGSAWYEASNVASTTSSTQLFPGDRSKPQLVYNNLNGKNYAVAKISGEAVGSSTKDGIVGPFGNAGSIYLVMNVNCDELVIGFAVSGNKFQGLVTYDKDWRGAGSFNYFTNANTWNAANYIALMSNDYSNNLVNLASAYRSITVTSAELQAIFDFFGFSYANPNAPQDANFLAASGLVTTAEAKYNVANAVVTTPDATVVIPKTGDAATSTGMMLVVSAILAAAAVGFVLSKRAFN